MAGDINAIIDDFELLDDWEDKYRYVIELGKVLPDFDDDARTAENKVNGCVSQVWLKTTVENTSPPIVNFEGDSDAHIVRGLVAIMLAALSGKPASEIADFDVQALLGKIGLDEHLTPQRSNGLRAMVDRMKHDAKMAQADT